MYAVAPAPFQSRINDKSRKTEWLIKYPRIMGDVPR